MPSTVYSCALNGIEAYEVEIEVDVLRGLPRFMVVGLGDTAVQESKQRVRSAILNSGATFPRQRKVVNLAPANTRKCGPAFDLAIAVGLLVESQQIPADLIDDALFIGELALDGTLRRTQGVLAYALFARQHDFKRLYVPTDNAAEAAMISGVEVIPVPSLGQLIQHLRGQADLNPLTGSSWRDHALKTAPTWQFKGSPTTLRAAGAAAAGGHHLLMSGPPGAGKTVLARSLRELLPPLSEMEAIDITQIYSVAGLLSPQSPMVIERPFRSVHHTASMVSLVGGGSQLRPGEISLAHRGLLFLDEIAEFPRHVLETLRQPLEAKHVTIARAAGTATYPCHFTLVAAMNPCPCGYATDPHRDCTCSPRERDRYQRKLSGPLLDRIDLFLEMPRLSFHDIHETPPHDVMQLRQSIQTARAAQAERFRSTLKLNSDMTPTEVKTHCQLPKPAQAILQQAMDRHWLTTRGYFRTLKVARTLADMAGVPTVQTSHLLEALNFRQAAQLDATSPSPDPAARHSP